MNESSGGSSSVIAIIALVIAAAGIGAISMTRGSGGGGRSANILTFPTNAVTVTFTAKNGGGEPITCTGGEICDKLEPGTEYTYVAVAEGYETENGEITGTESGGIANGICLVKGNGGENDYTDDELQDLAKLVQFGGKCTNNEQNEILSGSLAEEEDGDGFDFEAGEDIEEDEDEN